MAVLCYAYPNHTMQIVLYDCTLTTLTNNSQSNDDLNLAKTVCPIWRTFGGQDSTVKTLRIILV